MLGLTMQWGNLVVGGWWEKLEQHNAVNLLREIYANFALQFEYPNH